MSRIGKCPVAIPDNVKVELNDGFVRVEGPKGKLELALDERLDCSTEEKTIVLKRRSDNTQERAIHGLFRSLINNMVQGVSQGFKKDLAIQGVGYKVQAKGKGLIFDLGFSHQVLFDVPEEIAVKVNTPTSLTVEGIDKYLVGQVAANIRALKKPEPYKGKGIRYVGEQVRRKQGKKVG